MNGKLRETANQKNVFVWTWHTRIIINIPWRDALQKGEKLILMTIILATAACLDIVKTIHNPYSYLQSRLGIQSYLQTYESIVNIAK